MRRLNRGAEASDDEDEASFMVKLVQLRLRLSSINNQQATCSSRYVVSSEAAHPPSRSSFTGISAVGKSKGSKGIKINRYR